MNGIIIDLPNVIKAAKDLIVKRDYEDRCQVIACDFFIEKITAKSDVFLLSNILHDWPDDKCKMILENCRKAMKPASKLLIIEMIIPAGNGPSMAKLLDLEMLVMTGGKERTEEEFRSLIDSAGLNLEKSITLNEDLFVLECKLPE